MISVFIEIAKRAEEGLKEGKEKEALEAILAKARAILDLQKDWKKRAGATPSPLVGEGGSAGA